MKKYFLSADAPIPEKQTYSTVSEYRLELIYVYPLKSAGAFTTKQWPICETGLLFDREFVLVDPVSRTYLNQKTVPELALIYPDFNFQQKATQIIFKFPGSQPLVLESDFIPTVEMELNVCGDKEQGFVFPKAVCDWFRKNLRRECFLVRMGKNHSRIAGERLKRSSDQRDQKKEKEEEKRQKCPLISYSNESQFLIINQSSVEKVKSTIPDQKEARHISAFNFRPNFLIRAICEDKIHQPFEEDQWASISVNGQTIKMISSCSRCKMVCVDPKTATVSKEPLLTLARMRRQNGKIYFGNHAVHLPEESKFPYIVKCGIVTITRKQD